MPRPNQPRTIDKERQLAARIVELRDQHGFNNESLARRMTDAGCPIRDSAIYKIEKGDPPRRITVDELYGFAAAFDMTVTDLLVGSPDDPILQSKAPQYVHTLETLYRRRVVLVRELEQIGEHRQDALGELKEVLGASREIFESFREFIASEFNNWPDFLNWSGIDRIVGSRSRPRRNAKASTDE